MPEVEFAIAGAGALGSIIGAHLARAGHPVLMLVRERRAQQIAQQGLSITGLAEFSQPVATLTEPSRLTGAAVLIVATKTHGTEALLASLRGATIGAALSVQNGMMKDDLLAAAFGRQRVLGCLADMSGEMSASGEVLFTRNTNIFVGELDGSDSARARDIANTIDAAGVRVVLVDLSTSGGPSPADVPPHHIATYFRGGPNAVFTGERGAAITAMAEAFEAWIKRQDRIGGLISAGGSGGSSLVAPAMRALPIGVPKVLISSVASGNVAPYVGPSDIMMLYSVTDVAGLNTVSRQVLANGAAAMVGMVKARGASAEQTSARRVEAKPAIGLTMFGVTTPCVDAVVDALDDDFECLVFHATGVGGQSMEKLVDSGDLTGVIDITTTEVCDLLCGGVLPATEDRFGAIIRTRVPYIGSCGALDMVNFGPMASVPERYRGRTLEVHNPTVTLMRTTPEENARIGRWIGERLNRMDGPVRFFLPEGGVSALDSPGRPFADPGADEELFRALEATVRQTATRRLIRMPAHINDPQFAAEIVSEFRRLFGGRLTRRRARR